MAITWKLTILSILFCGLPMQELQRGPRQHADNMLDTDPAWSELKSSMEKMHKAMASVKSSGNSDVDFVKMMLPHHKAAIDMAKTQLMYGKDPEMRRLAQEIITEQQSEIELMHLWLKQHEPKK
jgi:uncharacterized protein (DUF305 family)